MNVRLKIGVIDLVGCEINMSGPRRYFPSKTPYLVTNRLSEGLPFVPNSYINYCLFAVIARANFRYPGIRLCGFLFLANHYHMLLILESDPEELSGFMNYVDGEIAKLVVRWLGKRNVKVWAQKYHAAPLLTYDSCLKEFVYIFANPVMANLSAKAKDWIGVSTLYSLESSTPRSFKWRPSSYAPRLPNGKFSKKHSRRLLRQILEDEEAPSYELPIDAFAWMNCYPETRGRALRDMKKEFYEQIAQKEKEAAQLRAKEKTQVADPEVLSEQNPYKYYKPKKFGRRVFCICSNNELRLAFIQLYRELCELAYTAYRAWVEKFEDIPVPHGMFSPPRKPRGSILPIEQFT